MPGNAAGRATPGPDLAEDRRSLASFLRRKIWLPKLLYAAVPYFYVLSGLLAFLATFYIAEWFWILPHYLLFSVLCIHIGMRVYRRRHRKSATKLIDSDCADPPYTS